jgi:hypothetical protein
LAAVWRQIQRRRFPADGGVAGIDVGEDYLDLAVIESGGRTLELARVDVRGCERASAGAIPELARRISRAAPILGRGAIAVVDSPRWPVDLDWARAFERARADSPGLPVRRVESVRVRAVDQALRGLIGELRAAGAARLRLAMFPTPRLTYFTAQVASATCKPHLRAFGRELFAFDSHTAPPPSGGTFTRFMLAGFAAYAGLARLQVTTYEGFPDLQFRLWGNDRALPSKTGAKRNGAGRAAVLEARRGLVAELAARLRVEGAAAVRTLDQADAAILALSVVTGSTAGCRMVVGHPAEGSFWLTLPAGLARLIPRPHD